MSNFFLRLKTAKRQQQQNSFENLLEQLGKADVTEIEQVLSQREVIQAKPELTLDIVNNIRTTIIKQKFKE